MFFRLLIILVLIPILELYFLIKIGSLIGAFNTIVLIFITAVVGSFLARREGIKVLYQIRYNLEHGIMPTEALVDGMLIFVAGAMLITPGFITDTIGFMLIIPISRKYIKEQLFSYFKKRIYSKTTY